jgi:hypothetical protein
MSDSQKIGASKNEKMGISKPSFYQYSQHIDHFTGLDVFIQAIFKDNRINSKKLASID